MSYSNNEYNFEMPHIEITGLIVRALAYRYPKTAENGKDMFGVIFYVRTKPMNMYKFGGNDCIKINVPMNKGEEFIREFNRITADVETERFSNVNIDEYMGLGIRVYVRIIDVNEYGEEYKVNEEYAMELMDEPIFMDKLPCVPVRYVSTKKETTYARAGRTFRR